MAGGHILALYHPPLHPHPHETSTSKKVHCVCGVVYNTRLLPRTIDGSLRGEQRDVSQSPNIDPETQVVCIFRTSRFFLAVGTRMPGVHAEINEYKDPRGRGGTSVP